MRRRCWLVLVVGLAVAGCTPSGGEVRWGADYEEGLRAYLEGRYAQGARRLSRVAAQTADPALRARASLLEGRCRLALKEFHQAEVCFRRGLQVGSLPREVRAGLELGLADSLYGQERYAEAAEGYCRLLRRYADAVPADEAAFKLALALQRSGRWAEARREFARLASRYPQSPRAATARRLSLSTEEGFSVQCGAFRSAGSARRVAEELHSKGFEARLVPIKSASGENLTAVRVGRCRTWAEAAALRTRLQAAGFEARIVP